jgi:Xaa-Pro aminopeptidase
MVASYTCIGSCPTAGLSPLSPLSRQARTRQAHHAEHSTARAALCTTHCIAQEIYHRPTITHTHTQHSTRISPRLTHPCAGAGPNGAIIHYRAQPGTCKSVDASTLLLLDSGGQYDCGTTDITRTMHFGQPTEHQKACFTAVLQVRGCVWLLAA